MKLILHIAFLSLPFLGFSQEWRDSLSVAREAYKNQEYGKALQYYESAQKKAPEDVDLSDELAQSAYKAREFGKAEKIYQQSGGSKKSSSAKAKNYHNLGNSRMKQKNYSGAVDAYKNALRENPNDEETRYNLSEAIRKLKEQEKKNQNQQQKQQQNQQQNQSGQQQNQSGQQQNNQQQNQQQNQSGQQQNNQQQNQQSSQSGSKQENPSSLPNKTVDRMLDQLMKDEAETKRKASGQTSKKNSSKSGKDW